MLQSGKEFKEGREFFSPLLTLFVEKAASLITYKKIEQ
jgi:hypothetical protein